MISLILSGGLGSRLWPLSREKLPKQFAPLFSESLFAHTVKRLNHFGEVQVCTSEVLKDLTNTEIRSKNLQVSQVFFEPMGRNTAPAIALSCWFLQTQGQGDEVLGVFPVDHWIEKEESFFKAFALAQKCAARDQIVTIGIVPSYPATGFGYIECLEESFEKDSHLTAFKVNGFREKPDQQTAEEYISTGNFFWNSGIFVFKVKTMVEAFKKFMPEMWSEIEKIEFSEDDTLTTKNIEKAYNRIQSQSLDFGIMEHAKNQVNIPCDLGWNDLGSWDNVAEISERETLSSQAEVHHFNSKNCFAHSLDKKTICFSEVEDLLVVDTSDALLITKKTKSQEVKLVYDSLKNKKSSLVTQHNFEYRPWGFYRTLYEEQNFKTKVITIDPGQQLSYQSHTSRSEIWVIVEGGGEVVINDKTEKVSVGHVVSISVGDKHRIRNSSKSTLKFVEVQLGSYFGEDDITRYQDDYKRT